MVGLLLTISGVFNSILCRVLPGGTVTVPPYLVCTLLHILLGNPFKSTFPFVGWVSMFGVTGCGGICGEVLELWRSGKGCGCGCGAVL